MASLTLGVPLKWLDNLLSHHQVPGVVSARQGVERSVSDSGLVALEIIRITASELGVPLGRATKIASTIMTADGDARFTTPSGAELRFPLENLERRLRDRMVDAVESVPRIPRGRPRKRA